MIVLAIWMSLRNRRWLHYAGVTGGFLTVAALVRLIARAV
jgi:hypothetical protein